MDTKKLKECFWKDGEPDQVQCVTQSNDASIDQQQDVEQVNVNEQKGCNVAVACDGTAVAVQYADQANYNAQVASICQANTNSQVDDGVAVFGGSCTTPDLGNASSTNFDAKMDKHGNLIVNGKKIKSKDFGDGLKMFVLGQLSKSKNVSEETKE